MNENLTKHNEFIVASMLRLIEINTESIGIRDSSIILQYFAGKKMDEIARGEDITKERVRQIIDRTKKRISTLVEKANIGAYNNRIAELEELVVENDFLKRTIRANNLSVKTPLAFLNLSERATNILSVAKIDCVEELSALQPEEIMKYRNAGQKTISELEIALNNRGLSWGGIILKEEKKLQ
ncbi:MAG TPA: DNA-directed RNA polymerase subunit alpha C-terminal domain-containing protein [Flavipsychrobacter sp.]|nr:DNA-directed RNA polymerase subunit alpha C-terminal domain-containing protein [Flavipsychrobacter sp.]